jgi:predicted RNase H-like HicB family nuclease
VKGVEINVVIEKTDTGFSAYIKEVDGVIAVADTFSQIKERMELAFKDHLEYLNETREFNPFSQRTQINYLVDLEQFFDYFSLINKTAFARYIGVNESLFRRYTKGLAPLSGKKMEQITSGLKRLSEDLKGLEVA